MGKFRRVPTQGLIKQLVQGQGRQPLFSSDHMAYFHVVVVYNISKVIGWHPIAFEKDLVIQGIAVYLYFSADKIR